jgi:nickel/cobalt exporter
LIKKLAVAAFVAALTALPATPASAHSLDEVIQQVYLTPAAATLDVQIDIVAGALVAPGFARSLDTDGDRRLSAAETSAHDVRVTEALALATDGAPAGLTVTGSSYPPFALLSAGGGVITVRATAPLPETTGAFAVTDGYLAEQKTRIQMSVLVAKDAGRAATSIRRGHEGRAIAVGLTRGAAGGAAAGQVKPAGGTGTSMLDALREPVSSPLALAVLIGVCALLGAFHALTPGHGKAMLAAYLVGSRGTPRQAIALGGIVTVTHTGSVLLLGAAVLAAGHYVMPALLVPGLQVLTGVVVLFLGARLLRRRMRGGPARPAGAARRVGLRRAGHRHVADDDAALGRLHADFTRDGDPRDDDLRDDLRDDDLRDDFRRDDDFDDYRDPRHRPHGGFRDDEDDDYEPERVTWHGPGEIRPAERRAPVAVVDAPAPYILEERERTAPVSVGSRRELAAMGAAGGLIPCPEALGVLILAVGLHRTALGLAMIVAFSAGLGAVLIGLGLILVTARDRFTDVRPGPLLRRLPVVSAAIVVGLGMVMTVSGIAAAL